LETGLRQELQEHLGWYERSPLGAKPVTAQRSGYWRRRVISDHGEIKALRVPKLRAGNKTREWRVLTRYQRCLQYLLDSLLYLYVLGLSVRDLQEALLILFGPVLSVSAINQVTLAAQADVVAWRNRPLTETPPVLLVDGVWVKILYPTPETWLDRAGHTRQQQRVQERVILAALAVWPDGRYHLLHYEVAEAEDDVTWRQFWQHLRERGLDPAKVEVVVSDGTKGLQLRVYCVLAALAQELPQTKLQRCTVHKVRGFERYLADRNLPTSHPDTRQPWTQSQAKAHRQANICADAHDIFKAPTRPEAEQRLQVFTAKWQPLEPAAVKNFTWGLKRCFVFYDFAPALRPLIHSTNLLERFFREFRAKSDEIGSFPNETSCLTVFYLVMVRDHSKHHRLTFANNSRH
jgi:transposase-like protein